MQTVLNEENIFTAIKGFLSGAYKDQKKRNKENTNYMGGSISRYTKNLVMTFPLLADDSLPINTIQMISKASERNITSMLQMLFSSMSLKGANGQEILSRFHKNIETMSMDDIIDTINKFSESATESALQKVYDREALNEMCNNLPKIMKEYPYNSLNEKSLNGYLVKSNGDKSIVYESPQMDKNIQELKRRSEERLAQYEDDQDSTLKDEREEDKFQYQMNNDADKKSRDEIQDQNNLLTRQLINQDIKKANELQPTLMVVNANDVDANGNIIGKISFAAGIKSRIIGVEAMDIVERVVAKNKTAINLKNLLRSTSGEISFVKDFLLCINQAKINAKNAVKKGEAAQIWNTLEKRAAKNTANKYARGNDASAITTLVINQETVNYIKNAFKVDLNVAKNAQFIMENFNLLALVIADESNEVAKFLYDGNNSFELVAYASLSRDMNDTSTYKKTVNLINQAGR